MKYTFSDKRDITGAFPISSRRATNTDWKLFDIHDDGLETLSAHSRSIFPQDEVSGRHIEERVQEHGESQEDESLDQDKDNRDEQSKRDSDVIL